MGAHTDFEREQDLKEAYDGPVVAAAAGYFLLDMENPDALPAPVLAWRIGSRLTLAVTATGCEAGEHFVLNPDGRVSRHFVTYGSALPLFWESREAWKADMAGDATSGDDYFGVCPHCGKTDGYLNVGLSHLFFCKEHKVKWNVGWNLFSSAKEQSEDEQRRLFDETGMGEFETVAPAEWAPRAQKPPQTSVDDVPF